MVWARLHPLRNDCGIQKEAHTLTFRGPVLRRLALSLDPRSGEAAKNSARLPERLVFRSHSSALTILAFASARVQVLGLITQPVPLNRDSPDEPRTVANIRAIPAFRQDRQAARAAAVTLGRPNGCRAAGPATFRDILTHSSRRLLLNA